MDWTKAKNILIIALLVTNLIIGAAYYGSLRARSAEWAVQAQNTEAYLQELGVALETPIPRTPVRMPVLFVRFEPPDPKAAGEPVYHKGVRVENPGGSATVIPLARGDKRREVVSASYALLKYLAAMDSLAQEPSAITGIELIYLVENAGYDPQISEDTAVPAWKLSLSGGQVFYVNAYGE